MKLIQSYRESDNLVDWLQRLIGVVADIENYRAVGGTGNPAFQNSWANKSGEAVVAFYKDPFERVHIKGHVDSGTNGTPIFTLPTGYRPSERLRFVTTKISTAIGMITINTSGTVISNVGNTNGVEINVSFRV